MINKKEFVRSINSIQNYFTKLDKIDKVNTDISIGISDMAGEVVDSLIRVLCVAVNTDPDRQYCDDISWFIFETDFGKKKDTNWIKYKNKKYIINTAEDLYDFLEFFNKEK